MTLLDERWRSGRHVGAAKPAAVAKIRLGHFVRGYAPWADPISARIYGESPTNPWCATWVPDSDWIDLPNVLQVDANQDYDNNGIQVATLVIENILFPERVGPLGDVYHLIDRGALSPWRGASVPLRGTPEEKNEWYGMLSRNAQVKLWLGYGDALSATWTGLIDDFDAQSAPDRVTVVARDFGQVLVDGHVFGWNKSKQLPEPTIFEAKRTDAAGVSRGHAAKASSTRRGHPARFVEDRNLQSSWISQDHSTAAVTEWVEVTLPRGRYESIAIHPRYAGMEVFVGIYARDDGRGGEPCRVDGEPIEEGWITAADLAPERQANTGTVPGTHGGWPYVRRWESMSDRGQTPSLPGRFDLGDNSILRVGFRRLRRIGPGVHRAGVVRLRAIHRKDPTPIRLKPVGRGAEASSMSAAQNAPDRVLDTDRVTRWLSRDRTGTNLTEWVEIHLPKGRYDSFVIEPAYAGMEMYVGVYARGKSKVDGNPVPEGFVALGNGAVPGAANGGWPWVLHVPTLEHSIKKAEKFALGHRFDLGENSVLRVGFSKLQQVEPGTYRAGVVRLKAMTRSPVEQSKPKRKVIEVNDVSDMVRVALRWAGFKEWNIEDTGVNLEQKKQFAFNRANTYMDIVKKAQEATGYVFFIAPPTEADLSLGIPTFVSSQVIQDPPELTEIRDTDLLTGIQAKATDEPLATNIRVRGKPAKLSQGGQTLGQEKDRTVMAHYRPPWGLRTHRMAGMLKHVIHHEPKARTVQECLVLAQLIALQQALVAAAVEIEIPGHPDFLLNQQVAVTDQGTGLRTRVYIARRHTSFTGGEKPSFKTSLGGALIDLEDVQGVIADLKSALEGVLPWGVRP